MPRSRGLGFGHFLTSTAPDSTAQPSGLTSLYILRSASDLAQRAKIPKPSPKGWVINVRCLRAESPRLAGATGIFHQFERIADFEPAIPGVSDDPALAGWAVDSSRRWCFGNVYTRQPSGLSLLSERPPACRAGILNPRHIARHRGFASDQGSGGIPLEMTLSGGVQVGSECRR